MRKNKSRGRYYPPAIGKRLLCLVTVLSMLTAFVPIMASAEVVYSGTCGVYEENNGKNLTWTLDSNGLLTISGKGKMGSGRIYYSPTFKYCNVLWVKKGFSIHSSEKEGKEHLLADRIKRVVINDGVTSIGEGSFYDCVNMESISIPNSVTEIYAGAFEDCKSLRSITIPDSVKSIGVSAFAWCEKLSNIKLSNSITKIDSSAFLRCSSLKNIEIPDAVEIIADNAFESCTNLSNIYVNNNNKHYLSVDGNLYSKDKTKLIRYAPGKSDKKYSIPIGVNEIGRYAFFDNSCISEIEAPSSIEKIYEEAIVPTCIGREEYKVGNSWFFKYIYQEIDLLYNGSEYQWNNLTAYYNGEYDGYNWSFTKGTIGECGTNNLLPNVNVKFMVAPQFSVTNNSVTNTSDAPQSAEVIIAEYSKNGAVKNITADTYVFKQNETKAFTVPTGGKLFVWDSLSGMRSLAK